MEENLERNTHKKIAVVTGASRGIGAEIVKTLAKNDYIVVLNYNKSKNLAEEIANNFANVYPFQGDVSQYNEIQNLINFTIDKFGHIDLLVNNAGIDLVQTITDTTFKEFDNLMKTNLYSAFFASKEVSKYMINQKSGHIINISSIWGITGASCEVAYSISKAGLDAMTKSLAKELGPSNIRVNSIAPGIIDTDMNSFLGEEEKKDLFAEIPLGRIGTTSEVAACVLFLENNPYITGQILQVNGGWNM